MTPQQRLDDRTRAMIERARSNAAGKHGDRRTARLRTRGEQRRFAIREAS